MFDTNSASGENRLMVERQDPTRVFIDSHKSAVNFTRAQKV